MIKIFIICSILMHFIAGSALTWMLMMLKDYDKTLWEKESRIIDLNKENALLQQACRTPTAKARYRKLRRTS